MIELRDVSYAYAPEQDGADAPGALHGVSLTVEDGEMLAIVGHNGSGKSTLAKHLNALLLPTAGMVLVDGMDTRDEQNVLEIRRRVGLVFQNPDNQLVTTIVEEDVGFGPENLGLPPEQIRARVAEALETVGMAAHAREATYALSGGQKQRVAIARMLLGGTPVMVFDDSLSAVDSETDAKIRAALRESLGRATVILISHRITTLMQADRILVLENGRVSDIGTHEELISRPGIYREIYDIQMSSDDRRLIEEGGAEDAGL